MYSFIGRYNGLDRSSYQRILKAILIMGCFVFLSVIPLIVFKESELLMPILADDFVFYSFILVFLFLSIYGTYRIFTVKEDKRPPELTIHLDGKFKYKKFKKDINDFNLIEFENYNIKVVENENKTLMITNQEGEQFVIYKQYNATNKTLKKLQKDFPTEHYGVLVKWFELRYEKREKKLKLVLCFAADMNKFGVFDMNVCPIF